MMSIESYAKKLERTEPGAKERLQERGWKSRARDNLTQVCLIYLILKDPQSPLLAKAVAALSVGYILSPIQLIPSFIPIIGWLDDIVVVSAGVWLLSRLTPAVLMRQCRANAVFMRAKLLREEISMQGPRTWRFLQ
jgi:uncharacterized membrane protein YkvA (DUF1232 family)